MFYLTKIVNGRINVSEPEFLTVTDGLTITNGEALVLASGKLAKCPATTVPEFIAGADLSANDTNRVIPVIRVESNQIYSAPLSVVPTAAVVEGAKVTLNVVDSAALGVTADTTSGVATIVSLNGATKAGDKVLVKF